MSHAQLLSGPAAVVATLLLGATALAGCSSGGGSSGGSAADSAASSGSVAVPKAAAGSAAGAGSARTTGSEAQSGAASGADRSAAQLTRSQLLTVDRSIVYKGELTVRVASVAAAVDRTESLATGAAGLVFAEQTTREPVGSGRRGAATAHLTVKVPAAAFRSTLDRIGGLGRELSREQSADDVTTEVVDVASRLRTQRRSVARMQALLDRATTVGEIVRVEGELSRREADLESLEAQQATLRSLTDLATIDVTLVGPRAVVTPPVKASHLGFLSGLRDGSEALLGVVVIALTAAGAALPFVLVLALVGVPVWVLLRRRRLSPGTPAATPQA